MSINKTYLAEIMARAEKARDKKAVYGPDLDLSLMPDISKGGK
jgi:hypothetical protein